MTGSLVFAEWAGCNSGDREALPTPCRFWRSLRRSRWHIACIYHGHQSCWPTSRRVRPSHSRPLVADFRALSGYTGDIFPYENRADPVCPGALNRSSRSSSPPRERSAVRRLGVVSAGWAILYFLDGLEPVDSLEEADEQMRMLWQKARRARIVHRRCLPPSGHRWIRPGHGPDLLQLPYFSPSFRCDSSWALNAPKAARRARSSSASSVGFPGGTPLTPCSVLSSSSCLRMAAA